MKYGIAKHSVVICDPIAFDADRFRDIVMRQGGDYTRIVPNEAVDLGGGLRILPGRHEDTPPENPALYRVGLSAWEVDGAAIVRRVTYDPLDLEEAQASMKRALAGERWDKETAGIDVDGQIIQTTREAQGQIASTYSALKDGLVASADWKADTGWVSVTLAEFEPIARAVAAHVQSCFSAEKVVSEQIDAATTVDELAQIDLGSAFDSAYQAASP